MIPFLPDELNSQQIAVLASGGVDSSVALRLLLEAGAKKITAFYLKIWLEDDLSFLGDCPWEEDLKFVREVCRQAKVPLEILPMQSEYWEKVVEHALIELRAGRTPSPDILCNQRIKFGEFFNEVGGEFTKIASGHYARREQRNGKYWLLRSPDPVKDQTYFLSHLSQEQVSRAIFPIGNLMKKEVRQLARRFDLPNQARKDSQGICFLGKISYRDFIKFHLGVKPGAIVELETGKKLGRHNGYWFYTIGQRQGLGLNGGPWYVVRKDVYENVIFVSHRSRHLHQAKNSFTISRLNWITEKPRGSRFQVKLRHGPKLIDCTIRWQDDSRLQIGLKEKDPGIAPGQYAVLYDDEICLGGGVIEAFETAVPDSRTEKTMQMSR